MSLANTLDRFIGFLAPRYALNRLAARSMAATLEQWTANSKGGYDGGKINRLNKAFAAQNLNENAVPRGQVSQLRWNSWDLFRNNPHARKIVRSLEAKVIGRGLAPASQALRSDGTAHVEFREAVERLWADIADEMDCLGCPGRGGRHMGDLQKMALRGVIMGGDVLYALRRRTPAFARDYNLTLPVQLQLIHAERLADLSQSEGSGGNEIYQGIELNKDGTRAAYHLYDRHPAEWLSSLPEPKRFPAGQIGHLYVAEDIDQIRGTPWFAAALMQMRDTADYQYNELKASALAACIVLGYRRASGQSSLGVNPPTDWDLTDADGNKISHIQPGMLLDLGMNGEIQGFNPARPSTSAEAWIQHMIRSTATALPGVKASTLTGDYRNSSFSSERSADNDNWPEIEGLQDWFCSDFMHPVYQEIIRTAVLTGYFDGIVTDSEFADNEKSFLSAAWQGPVALSINPTDDATAAALRIQNGTSSPQIECAKLGRNWRKIQRDVYEYMQAADDLQIEPEYVDGVFTIQPEHAQPDTAAA
jgi:lambda family phage portal protein